MPRIVLIPQEDETSSTPRTWNNMVKSAIREMVEVNETFTRQELIRKYLSFISLSVRCQGVTPEQTLSRVLQEIRKEGYISFKGSGVYQLRKKIPEYNIEIFKWKGERQTAMALTSILGFEESYKILKDKKKAKKILESKMLMLSTFGFIPQAKMAGMNWRGPLRYDFYFEITDINGKIHKCAIEYHGEQHDHPVEIFGGVEGYLRTVSRDFEKARFSLLNSINILYIRSTKYDDIYDQIRDWVYSIKQGIIPPITEYDIEILLKGA